MAIDGTEVSTGGPATDLNGETRPQGDYYDYGAFEYVASDPPTPPVVSIVVTTADDTEDSTDGLTSLREAIKMAAGGDVKTITFANGITKLNVGNYFYLNGSDYNGITIDGGGDVVIGGTDADHCVDFVIFYLGSADNVTFKGLTFQYIATDDNGTAIDVISDEIANLTVDSCNFFHNTSNYMGGAICVDSQDLNLKITSCVFFDNRADDSFGGALYVENTAFVLVENSRFENNTACNGGAVAISSSESDTAVEIKNSIFRENTGDDEGGAIYVLGADLEIVQSLIADNISSYGAGIDVYGDTTLNISWSTLANNNDEDIGNYSNTSTITISNSIVLELPSYGTVTASNVISGSAADLFTDGTNADPKLRDYTLKADPEELPNPAIDATGVTGSDPEHGIPDKDLNGNPRPVNNIQDCGAYEYQGASPASLPYSDAADAAFSSLDEDDLKVDFDAF